MLWLVEQGLVAPIAISSFALLLTILIVKLMIKVKGDNMMENKANVYFGLTDVSCSITEKRNLAVLLNFLFSNFI